MKPKRKPERPKPKPPALKRSDDLCRALVRIAAFNLHDSPEAQMAIYKAVRQLQLLDAAAEAAGIFKPRR